MISTVRSEVTRIALAATSAGLIFAWSDPASAQNEEWRKGLRAAQNAQFDAGNGLDAARDCVATETRRSERLKASYRDAMANRQADLERDRIWREKLRSEREALNLYDSNPRVTPTESNTYFKWMRGKALRESAGPRATPQPILAAIEELRRLQGEFAAPNRIRNELDQSTAKLGDCESRIPVLEEALEKAREQYDAHMRDILPVANSDINRLAELANDAAEASRMCSQMECPSVDCADSARRLQAIVDAEAHINDMVKRLGMARADAHRHHKALADQLRANSDRRDSVDNILKAQEILVGAGSAILDATSAFDGIQNLFFPDADDATGMLAKLDAAFELIKDIEGATTSAVNLLNVGELNGPLSTLENRVGERMTFKGMQFGPTVRGLTPQLDASDLKSRTSDIYANILEAKKYFSIKSSERGWSTEKAKALRFNVLQLVGSFAKDYAKASIEETKDRLRELARSIEAETAVMAPAAEQIRRIEDRHSLATDALYALQNARSLQQSCADKACKGTKPREPAMPDFTTTSAAAEATGGAAAGWGEALRYHNAQLPKLSNAMPTSAAQVSGRICRGAPMTLTFRQSVAIPNQVPNSGGGLVGNMTDVAKQIENAGGQVAEGTYSITITPVLERRADGTVTTRFEASDISSDVSANMPSAEKQQGRREMSQIAARFKRSELAAQQLAGGDYAVDFSAAIGKPKSLSGEASGRLTCGNEPARACEPAR